MRQTFGDLVGIISFVSPSGRELFSFFVVVSLSAGLVLQNVLGWGGGR